MKLAEARTIALRLPNAVEAPHHHMNSFRVNGKIFATVPDETHLHIFVDEERRELACAMYPDACEKLWWGKKVVGVKVDLEQADAADVEDLLQSAWQLKGA